MSHKYDNPSGPPPGYIQSPPQAYSQPQGESAGYYGGAVQQHQYGGSPAPYQQQPYGQQPYGQQMAPYQQQYPMQYQQPGYPPQGYYQDDRGYGQRGGAGTGICAGLLGACACLACFDLCLFF